MVAIPQAHSLSVADYLQFEAASDVKHEYRAGEVYAMASATDAHSTIAGNLFVFLRNHVRGSGCRVYMSDMKARLERSNCFYYPDLLVTCDPRDQETATYKRFPKLIVEVLSPSTEAFDRGDKFADYQTLESLEEYVLISTSRQRVDCFRHSPEGIWTLQFYLPNAEVLPLQSIGLEVQLSELYEDVTLPPPPTASESSESMEVGL
ncbi:Uma2 family endonuclease [Synechococcus elongatus]|uniref:Uma2 family endonuclease n=1 Tax=Synechococcus elongatus PCC 11801 TaxID=2219813 RepID=A0AAN1QMB3_SYNEL|nr:Uma2 family endonuclease [Synechococcus elongatus]AZB71907.1 Uma2 family endonuclease [Synechococcus elongatus PCC 11801]